MVLVFAIACLFIRPAHSAPNGYSVNSDSDNDATHDSLYLIDLANGGETRRGAVRAFGQLRTDIEGVALAPDGTLYGLDDDNHSLFPINTSNGLVVTGQEVFINGIPGGGGNDFGMAFSCDGTLYVSSVKTRTLYRMALDGQAIPIGAAGSLGADISALAAYGNPTQLFGLSNGSDDANPANARKLWSIDTQTGTASAIGALGAAALQYAQAGLDFDESGMLWAITDRRDNIGFPLPSQILKLNTSDGSAIAVSNVSDNGFESLAIGPPSGCFDGGGGDDELARFMVTKRFMDHNDLTTVALTLTCNTGLPLEQTLTVGPGFGFPYDRELTFVVRDFESGALDCQLSEQVPTGYQASYSCDGQSACSAGAPSPIDPYFQGPCSFTGVEQGDDNICFIRNYVAPVNIGVTKIWIDENEQFQGPTNAQMTWTCVNARSSGDDLKLGTETGFLEFHLSEQTRTFQVFPNFNPGNPTVCTIMEQVPGFASDIESDDDECDGLLVTLGGGASCTVFNTRLYEGIPTLSQYGKLLLALLMLSAGLFGVRRIL